MDFTKPAANDSAFEATSLHPDRDYGSLIVEALEQYLFEPIGHGHSARQQRQMATVIQRAVVGPDGARFSCVNLKHAAAWLAEVANDAVDINSHRASVSDLRSDLAASDIMRTSVRYSTAEMLDSFLAARMGGAHAA